MPGTSRFPSDCAVQLKDAEENNNLQGREKRIIMEGGATTTTSTRTETITTPLTQMLGIKNPIMLAGMNVAAGPELAAAVTNAGGMGVIGGVFYTPEFLKKQIQNLKSHLVDKSAPFGVDLLLPQVGGNARKTNVRL